MKIEDLSSVSAGSQDVELLPCLTDKVSVSANFLWSYYILKMMGWLFFFLNKASEKDLST